MMVHKHNFKINGRSMCRTYLSCSCGERKEREATKPEQRYFKKMMRDQDTESKLMHGIYWEFCNKFMIKNKLNEWKYSGYDLMQRVEKWAKKYPKDVFVCGIDNSLHENSDMVFILHRLRRKLWGTTAVVISQIDRQAPCEFFMYPGHMNHIYDIFQKIKKFPSLYPV